MLAVMVRATHSQERMPWVVVAYDSFSEGPVLWHFRTETGCYLAGMVAVEEPGVSVAQCMPSFLWAQLNGD